MPAERVWLTLLHQLPPEPPGLRVRIWRRLQAVGALPLKSSVYVLPDGEETREDFDWLLGEIVAAGAEGALLRSTLLGGLTDAELVERFRAAAAAEYGELLRELKALAAERRPRRGRPVSDSGRRLARLGQRLAAIERRDFFGADGREAAASLLARLGTAKEEDRMRKLPRTRRRKDAIAALRGQRWVTRAGVKVDRTASAWLVRRFVDPQASFAFVDARTLPAAEGQVRFDMAGGEFTHEGDACTFEVLVRRLGLAAPGLAKLGEIVHDLDLKDERYGHPENAGVAAFVAGLAASGRDDDERIDAAMPFYDALLASFAVAR